MIIYLPDISKSNLPMKLLGDKIVYKYSGDKHAQLIYECITHYVYAYQLRCPKQDVLRTLIKVFLYVRHRSRHNKPFIVHDAQRFREEISLNVVALLFLKVGKLGLMFNSLCGYVQTEMAPHFDNIVKEGFTILLTNAIDKALVDFESVKTVHIECCQG